MDSTGDSSAQTAQNSAIITLVVNQITSQNSQIQIRFRIKISNNGSVPINLRSHFLAQNLKADHCIRF